MQHASNDIFTTKNSADTYAPPTIEMTFLRTKQTQIKTNAKSVCPWYFSHVQPRSAEGVEIAVGPPPHQMHSGSSSLKISALLLVGHVVRRPLLGRKTLVSTHSQDILHQYIGCYSGRVVQIMACHQSHVMYNLYRARVSTHYLIMVIVWPPVWEGPLVHMRTNYI